MFSRVEIEKDEVELKIKVEKDGVELEVEKKMGVELEVWRCCGGGEKERSNLTLYLIHGNAVRKHGFAGKNSLNWKGPI